MSEGPGAYREIVQLPGGGVKVRPWDGDSGQLQLQQLVECLDLKPGTPPANAETSLTSIAHSLKRLADRIAPYPKTQAPVIQLEESQFKRLMESLNAK